jgi:hypothetical protein
MEGNTMQLVSKFTAAEINAVIEASRRGEIKLESRDYNDKTLTAALDRECVTPRGLIAEEERRRQGAIMKDRIKNGWI